MYYYYYDDDYQGEDHSIATMPVDAKGMTILATMAIGTVTAQVNIKQQQKQGRRRAFAVGALRPLKHRSPIQTQDSKSTLYRSLEHETEMVGLIVYDNHIETTSEDHLLFRPLSTVEAQKLETQ